MVLPILFGLGLPALAGSGAIAGTALGATLAGMSVPALAGIGAGLGSFIQTGDLGEGIKTGLTSFLGGKILGGLTGSTSAQALNAGQQTATGVASEGVGQGWLQSIAGPSPAVSEIVAAGPSGFATNLLGSEAASGALGSGITAAGAALTPAFIGQSSADLSMMNRQYAEEQRRIAEERESKRPPMPRPMGATYSADPFASGGGEGLYFQYQRPPAPPGYTPQYPYYYAGGGILSVRRMQEGGDVGMDVDSQMAASGMNEKDVIMEAIKAIRGASQQPEIVLGMFVQKYGEDALRDLVARVESGEFDDTVERFASGENGMVRGPGDGSGVDDMVPATLEGEQDVLLSDGEFVLRKRTADALEKAYGGGFLDMVNRSEEDAPRKLEAMVG
jgi:hypothetical protein